MHDARFRYPWCGFLSIAKKLIPLILLAIFLPAGSSNAEPTAESGQKLFKQYCTSCHQINNKMVGPALKDVHLKRSEEWLIKWIRNNAELRKSGDKDAIAIYEEYGKNEMPAFLNFTDDDVKSVIAYIKVSSEGGTVGGAPAVPGTSTETTPAAGVSPYLLYAVIGILLIVLIVLFRTNKTLHRVALERTGEKIPAESTWREILLSKKAWAFYGLILIFITGWTVTDSAIRLGHSKNYAPEQPIKYSHKLHAGTLQINCLYCHHSADDGKVAGIPPVSTCMNCHKGVQQGESEAGTAEIQKIYAAFDNNRPIEWVRIHNLPDHVYFNHAQHVAVGKIECQTCHGPIEEMEKVYQFSSLSMGWCLNCHRQTKVNFEENGFYGMYETLHEELKNNHIDSVTAEMIGATECQKCHY